jgi:hypothetical protein
MPGQLDNDTRDRVIRFLAEASAAEERVVGIADAMRRSGVRDEAAFIRALKFWIRKGAASELVSMEGGGYGPVRPLDDSVELLAEWERRQAEAAHTDLVAKWLGRIRRHRAGAVLLLAIQFGLPLLGAAGGVLGGLAYFSDPAPVQVIEQAPPPTDAITARRFQVTRVVDGDTFKIVYDGEATSVRILGIDTPERGEPGFEEATAALRALIAGRVVRLAFPEDRKRDSFGRLLATVHVNGLDVGDVLLRRGLAERYRD